MITLCIKNVDGVWFGVACDETVVFGTTFDIDRGDTLRRLLSILPFDVAFRTDATPFAFAEKTLDTLKHIYDGKDVSFNPPISVAHLSEFNRGVLESARAIPVGCVTSYGGIARVAGGSPRAVGHVMATNPFAPIVPCHRVIASDFTLGGYGGGLRMKFDFLVREKRGYKTQLDIPLKGRVLTVFPVERVFEKLKAKR